MGVRPTILAEVSPAKLNSRPLAIPCSASWHFQALLEHNRAVGSTTKLFKPFPTHAPKNTSTMGPENLRKGLKKCGWGKFLVPTLGTHNFVNTAPI